MLAILKVQLWTIFLLYDSLRTQRVYIKAPGVEQADRTQFQDGRVRSPLGDGGLLYRFSPSQVMATGGNRVALGSLKPAICCRGTLLIIQPAPQLCNVACDPPMEARM